MCLRLFSYEITLTSKVVRYKDPRFVLYGFYAQIYIG